MTIQPIPNDYEKDGSSSIRPFARWSGSTYPVYVPKSPLAKRLAGIAKVCSDLSSAREALLSAQKQGDALTRNALWFLAATTYARCFLEGAGRRFKLEERDHLKQLEPALRKFHEYVMHIRHNLLAHAGVSRHEGAIVQVVLDPSPEHRGVVTVMVMQEWRPEPPTHEIEEFLRLISVLLQETQPLLLKAVALVKEEANGMSNDFLYANAVSTELP